MNGTGDPGGGGGSGAIGAAVTGTDVDLGPGPAPSVPVACPHCGASNPVDNLFCESCGYDFTTGQAPPAPEPAPTGPADPGDPAGPGGPGGGGPVAAAGEPPETQTGGVTGWTVVVEVDPVWFSLKGELADRGLPPTSTSTVPVFGHTSLIGRTSQSRGLRPEIALDTDTAVSRRHAQLVFDGERLSVVDLSSTNGTYVLAAGQAPTDDLVPLAAGVAHPLADGDQVYVGAWSRLTVRHT
jgi:hypothetical protein